MNFKFTNLKGDIFGGVTAGIVALPLALAFGVQSGMGAIAGLYGAIAIGIFAAIFGGTATQVSGPTGPMTVVSAAFIGTQIDKFGSLETALPVIIATFLLAGVIQILFGVIRIGKYVKYIPYPVVSGFMSGIGVIIIILQIFPFFGHDGPSNIIKIFQNVAEPLSNINWAAVGLASLTIAIIYLFPKVTKAVPSTLVALIAVTLLGFFGPFDVPVIGDIPKGLPELMITEIAGFKISMLATIIIPAVTLAALGAIDSLLTSLVADNITKTKHNSNKELIGQGIGNVVTSFIGGIPGAGATMRTVVNVKTGGKTKLSGVIHGVLLLVILLGAGSLASKIPLAVLAGILITVGIGIVDYKGLKHIRKVPRSDAAVMIIVLFLTVFVDLLQAVGIGMVLAAVLFMKDMGDVVERKTKIGSLKKIKEKYEYDAFRSAAAVNFSERVYVKRINGPMFFGFTDEFKKIGRELPVDEIDTVVFRLSRVPYIDQSGLYALEDSFNELKDKGVEVLLVGVESRVRDLLEKIHIVPDIVPDDHIFDSFKECTDYMENKRVSEGESSNKRASLN